MRRPDWRPLVVPLSIGGYINGVVWLAVGFGVYGWQFPGIDVYTVFTPAGQDFLADQRPYGGLFFYGPPWAPIMGAFALGPEWLLHATIIVLDVVALWVIAGRSWIGVGYLLWFPLVMSEMAAGQLNILCAAAMVEAQRGRVWPLAVMSWAKLWPALALPIGRWRSFLLVVLAIGVVAVPWPHLFPDWIEALIGNLPDPVAPLVPVPFLLRLPIALVLIAMQRPWTRTLGALLASPNLYWGQLVVVVAPISLWIQSRMRPVEPTTPEPVFPSRRARDGS
jgi:hypothetical protein